MAQLEEAAPLFAGGRVRGQMPLQPRRRVLIHRAQLPHPDAAPAEAATLLRVEDRAAIDELDGQRRQADERQEHGGGGQHQRHVQPALHPPIGRRRATDAAADLPAGLIEGGGVCGHWSVFPVKVWKDASNNRANSVQADYSNHFNGRPGADEGGGRRAFRVLARRDLQFA